MRCFRRPYRGFSLVEMLVVLAIAAILMSLIVPSLSGVLGGLRLTTGTENVIGALSNARQLAVTKNRELEIRLLTLKNPEIPSSTEQIRGVQLREIREDGGSVILTTRIFPDGIVIGGNSAVSTLANLPVTVANAATGDIPIPRVGLAYSYRSFRARPDGSFDLKTRLPAETNWFVTLYDERSAPAGSTPPANFATIQIEPSTGDTALYRP